MNWARHENEEEREVISLSAYGGAERVQKTSRGQRRDVNSRKMEDNLQDDHVRTTTQTTYQSLIVSPTALPSSALPSSGTSVD